VADPIPCQARTTTTLYSYLERLAAEQVPRSASLLLGLRWCFGVPAAALTALTEYSLPANPVPLERALALRGGLHIAGHHGDGRCSLYDHLASGRPAIAGADTYYLPFRPAFGRIHSSRTVLVRPGERGSFEVHDGWIPASTGTLSRADLDAARYSEVPLDVHRETLFSGNPIGGLWYRIDVEPIAVPDAPGWARHRLACLYDEMTVARSDERGEYGLAALSGFRRRLEESLALPPRSAPSIALRRGASLLLRTELSSRRYFGVFLRNAAHLLGDPVLAGAALDYRRALGHWQSAMDVLTKTVRTHRPEYDAFLSRQLAVACDNEERLAEALAGYADAKAAAAAGRQPGLC
jgi:hypothetical protein